MDLDRIGPVLDRVLGLMHEHGPAGDARFRWWIP